MPRTRSGRSLLPSSSLKQLDLEEKLMKRVLSVVLVLVWACPMAMAKGPAGQANDEAAVRAAVAAYVAAYNRGDAKAVAAFWSDNGLWISPDGQRVQGRAAIEKELAAMFTEGKGLHIEVLDSSIRFLTADVAVEEGKVRVTKPGEAPTESTYIALQVKQAGQWKLDSVRETEVPAAQEPASPLAELDWLVGDWIDQSPDATIATSVAWMKNKTFLHYTFTVSAPGADDLEGTQIIGWDPEAGQIRSWMFDSDGGFGEGTWSKKGNHWIVKLHHVLADGRKASSTNVYTPVDHNTFTWKSIGREVAGEFLPNIAEVKVVRKAATKPATRK
jgi:uncharacterized protein (TIGR02246 family)